jgi:hypothetical protein
MDLGPILRRLVHVSAPLFAVYYLLPDPVVPGFIGKQPGLFILLAIILVIEALRLYFKPHIIGMREYEYHRVSAAAWTALGMTLVFAFFPIEIAIPVLIGMGWVDPLLGIMRARKSTYYPAVPIIIYFVLIVGALTYFLGLTPAVVVAAVVATALGITSEIKKNWYIDDDFLMILVPAIGMSVVFYISSLL